jgi:hypothetical protein
MVHPLATLAAILLAANLACPRLAHAQISSTANRPEPLIEMDGIPLDDAIRNVARQWSMNYIVDARLLNSGGSLATNPSIAGRWHVSGLQLLEQVLRDHGMIIITNAATSISRIVPTNAPVQPVPERLPGNGSDPAIPLLRIDNSLDKAITDLAARAHVSVLIDSGLPVPSAKGDPTVRDCQIYVRWENVTARQALAAILDNYNLAIAGDPAMASSKIVVKTTGALKSK